MDKEAAQSFLKTLWNGDVPLARTFWQYYFIVMLVLGVLGHYIALFGIVGVVWAGFMVMPIWRAADKYKGKPIFALLAKIAAVLIGLGVLGSLLG